MSNGAIPSFRIVRAAGADEVAFNPDDYERTIAAVEGAGAVQRGGDGRFQADWDALIAAAPSDVQRVKDALHAANSNPVAREAEAQAASASDVAKNIKDVADLLKKGPDVAGHVSALVSANNTHVQRKWWGLRIEMNHEAATSLAAVASGDITSVLGALTVFVPAAAPVSLIVGAIGSALAVWVAGADHGNGVILKLYGYAIPWVTSA